MARIVAALLASIALWVVFVAGTKPEEMIVGFVCILIALVFTDWTARRAPLDVRFRMRDIMQGLEIPWCILSGAWEITAALALDLLGIRPAESLFRAAPFDRCGDRSLETARQVLAIAYTSSTPNCIVLGVDVPTRRMLFHQVKRSALHTMTRNLGAHQ